MVEATMGATEERHPDDAENADVESNSIDPASIDPAEVSARIRSHVIASMGLGLIPVPVFDLVAIIGVQLKLVHSLSRLYGVKYTENTAKTLILSLIAGVIPVTLGASLASFVKMIPGLGSFSGAAGVSILSGALTYAVGSVFAAHFASGGTLMSFDAKAMRKKFREQFRKGKAEAAKMASEEEQTGETSPAETGKPAATAAAAS